MTEIIFFENTHDHYTYICYKNIKFTEILKYILCIAHKMARLNLVFFLLLLSVLETVFLLGKKIEKLVFTH